MSTTSAASSRIQAPTRNSRAQYALAFLIITVCFLLLAGYQIYTSKLTAQAAATTHAKNLVLVLESKLSADFAAAESTVAAMVSEFPPEAMRPEMASRYRARVSDWLKANVRRTSAASALRYFDANGDRLYSSLDDEFAFNIADAPFFQRFKDDPASASAFSDVTIGRYSGRASMYVGKPVRDNKGGFLGVALSVIDLNSLYQHFRSIDLGSAGAVGLRRLDNGALVVRFPGPAAIDNGPAEDLPIRQAILKGAAVGTEEITSPVDGNRRIYGYRTVGSFPFFVVVGIAEGDYLGEWRRNSISWLIGGLLFVALLAAVFLRLGVAESRRANSEVELRESEQRLRKLIDCNDVAILQSDPESGRILDANAAALRFYGWSHEQLCAKSMPDIDQFDSAIVEAEREAALKERRECRYFSHQLADGTTKIVEVHSTPIAMASRPLLVSIVIDITERMRSEERLEDLMREQKAILNSRIVGFVKLKDRRFVWVNEALAAMFGYTVDEMIGQPTRLGYTSDEAYAEFASRAYKAMLDGEVFRTEIQLLHKDGAPRWYEVCGGMLYPGGEESIWAFVDIDSRKRAEDALRNARSAAGDSKPEVGGAPR